MQIDDPYALKRSQAEQQLLERIDILKLFRGNGEHVMDKLKLLDSLP